MSSSELGSAIAVGAALVCIYFVVILLLIKPLWAWTIPELFPGAVEQGLVAGSISWLAAGKISLVIAIISGTS